MYIMLVMSLGRQHAVRSETAAKVNKKLGFLNRNLKINNPHIKSRAYKTVVRPTLEY